MEYRFVHHRDYALNKQEHQTLEEAALLANQERSESFLKEIASFIYEETHALYVLIGRLSHDQALIQTCTFMKNGQVLENISYPLHHTPCDSVLTQRFCYYPTQVQDVFPLDTELQELQIDSYLGSIFLSEDSEPVGLIALMDNKPLENPGFAEHLILVMSPAIEEELTKIRAQV